MTVDCRCGMCGTPLKIENIQILGGITLDVQKCTICSDEAREKGRNKGYFEGWNVGHEEGYNEGLQAGYQK